MLLPVDLKGFCSTIFFSTALIYMFNIHVESIVDYWLEVHQTPCIGRVQSKAVITGEQMWINPYNARNSFV